MDARVHIGGAPGVTATSKTGLRKQNQDFALSASFEIRKGVKVNLSVVCDGMGGLTQGDRASKVASMTFRDALSNEVPTFVMKSKGRFGIRSIEQFSNFETRDASYRRVLSAVENDVFRLRSTEAGMSEVGTTLTALVSCTQKNKLKWCDVVHLGDTRCYRFTAGSTEGTLMTNDHSVAWSAYDSGAVELHEVSFHPENNMLTQSIGRETRLVPQITELQIERGDSFVLCCDGVWGSLHDEHGFTIPALEDGPSVDAWLVDEALAKGSKDNCTAMLVRF